MFPVLASWGRRLSALSQEFWFYPAVVTVASLVLAQALLVLDRAVSMPPLLANVIYDGGVDGARGVLSTIAASVIGVAGTVFSISVAALAYTAGSMGPRLLTNFTRDRGNQFTLATFLATFAFSLYSLRAVGLDLTTGPGSADGSGDPYVPHLNVSVAFVLAMGSVAMLVFFISHVSKSINTTYVIGLLRDDLEVALRHQLRSAEHDEDRPAYAPPPEFWETGERCHARHGGYLQHLDLYPILHAAQEQDCAVHVPVRPGDYVFPGAVLAVGVPRLPEDVSGRFELGRQRRGGQDVEFTVNQMAEVAVRALSPGINDPFTAVEVIDRFADVLCELAGSGWQTGVFYEDTRLRLVQKITTYDGLVDVMFTAIRQNAAETLMVLLRMIEVLTAVVSISPEEHRRRALTKHAELAHDAARRLVTNDHDGRELRAAWAEFERTRAADPLLPGEDLPGLVPGRVD